MGDGIYADGGICRRKIYMPEMPMWLRHVRFGKAVATWTVMSFIDVGSADGKPAYKGWNTSCVV